MKLIRDKSHKVKPNNLLSNYIEKYDICGKATITQKELHKFQGVFFIIIPDNYESIQMSPLVPLATCSSITKLSQDTRMSTIRNSEIVSDSTTAMALEASLRRKKFMYEKEKMYSVVDLFTFHRILRLQKFDKRKGFLQHFEILGMLSSGRAYGKNSFINKKIFEHIKIWIFFIKSLNQNGYSFKNIKFTFSDICLIETIMEKYNVPREVINKNSLNDKYDYFKEYCINLPTTINNIDEIKHFFDDDSKQILYNKIKSFEYNVINILRLEFPEVKFEYELDRKLGLGYFSSFCYHGFAVNDLNEFIPLIDGGVVNWLGQLLSDNREMAVTSSFGVELAMNKFRINNC